jgi:hypothetical protein
MQGRDARDAHRFVSQLLDREWDPIGVYRLPTKDPPSPGEYDTYAGWITKALLSGGGLDEVLSCLQRGRRRMGLEAPTEADEPTARLIVERWRSRG